MMPDIDETPLSQTGRTRVFLFYAATGCAAVVAFLFIRSIGEGMQAPAGTGQATRPWPPSRRSNVFHALLALARHLVVTARVVGRALQLIGPPR